LHSQAKNTQSADSTDSQPALIEYRNVTVSRNDFNVLSGITLSIALGEHVAILGPNGAGKSFLIRTMTRQCYPNSDISDASVRILGKDTWDVFELRNLLGIVSSDLVTLCKVTPAMEKKTQEIMKLLEISHLAERRMNEISTGEARRLVIGRALVHNPKALVLDEPSSSLDFHAAYKLRQILRKIAKSGISIIMVTHNITDIIPDISRVIFIKDGKISGDGPKDKVLTSESLSHLFDIPLEVRKRDSYYYLW